MDTPISLRAAYRQLYLFDEVESPTYPEDITDLDLRARAKAVPNLVAIYTVSDGEVEIRIAWAAVPRPFDESMWSHIVEAPLAVPSGRIVVASPDSYLPDCARVAVPPGTYRVRIAGRGFGEAEQEQYWVSMWPDTATKVSVLKSAGPYAA